MFLASVVVGFVVLTFASDHFVLGSARLARRLRVSPVLIGALVIGFGTSSPELFVSTIAALGGHQDLAVGNVVGSNLANLTLILAVAALITPLVISTSVISRESMLALAASALFGFFVQGGLSRAEGLILLGAFAVAFRVLLAGSREGEQEEMAEEVEEFVDGTSGGSLSTELLRVIAGLLGTLGGAQLLVYGARNLAAEFGASEGFIGLTLVAVGTSLPELFTAIQAARRSEDELVVGNLLGSNLFNSLVVGGSVGTFGPGGLLDHTVAGSGVVIMVALSVAAVVFMATGRRLVKAEALLLLVAYVIALPVLTR